MTQMTIDQYKQLASSNSKGRAKFSKYKAVPTKVDGIRFHSKKEAEYYKKLKDQQSNGEIARFHRQVIFDLHGGIKYLCDFEVIKKDPYGFEWIEYVDVKGYMTQVAKIKIKQVEDIYGIEIKLI
jgi:Protein of unknown function (DUF1064)